MTDGLDEAVPGAVQSADAPAASAVDPALAGAVEEALAGPDLIGQEPPRPNRVLGADPHDFAGLYIRHRSSFAHQARRFLRDQRDIDEVVQEAFLRLFLALPELETELQALAYCRRTVTNLCIDRYRADMRRPKLVNIETVPAEVFPDSELNDPVVQAEDAAFVREALALLTPLHREALIKREIEEKSIPVIAAELDVPEDSVKHLLHRARRALRRHLAKTHLAPGADLDATTTLSLLGRSAVSGGGRLGVIVVFLGLVLLGTKPEVSQTVLTSWPLGDLLPPAVTEALAPSAPDKEAKAPRRERTASEAVPQSTPLAPAGRPQTDTFVSLAQPSLAATPAPTPEAQPSASSSASPSATPSGSSAPSPSPSGGASSSPSGSPSSSPSTSPSSSPSASSSSSPSSRPSAEPSKARSEKTPEPEPSSGADTQPADEPADRSSIDASNSSFDGAASPVL